MIILIMAYSVDVINSIEKIFNQMIYLMAAFLLIVSLCCINSDQYFAIRGISASIAVLCSSMLSDIIISYLQSNITFKKRLTSFFVSKLLNSVIYFGFKKKVKLDPKILLRRKIILFLITKFILSLLLFIIGRNIYEIQQSNGSIIAGIGIGLLFSSTKSIALELIKR